VRFEFSKKKHLTPHSSVEHAREIHVNMGRASVRNQEEKERGRRDVKSRLRQRMRQRNENENETTRERERERKRAGGATKSRRIKKQERTAALLFDLPTAAQGEDGKEEEEEEEEGTNKANQTPQTIKRSSHAHDGNSDTHNTCACMVGKGEEKKREQERDVGVQYPCIHTIITYTDTKRHRHPHIPDEEAAADPTEPSDPPTYVINTATTLGATSGNFVAPAWISNCFHTHTHRKTRHTHKR
jgi:hypothetical protein